jgi:hypothetical protein
MPALRSILKKRSHDTTKHKLFQFGKQQSDPLIVLGMCIAFGGCIVLCAINPQLLNNIALQSLTSAAFAVFAAVLYLLYMIISRVMALVLLHIESRQHPHDVLVEQPEVEEADLLEEEVEEEEDELFVEPQLPRETIIASMYLGGAGVFLAIPPLCMWDLTISSSFVLALLVIAFLDSAKVATDFRANVDTVSALLNLKRLRLLYQGAILNLLVCVISMDGRDRILFPPWNATALTSSATAAMQGQQWPLVLLAASSPFLLRGGPSRRAMTPSQTLETGLPVCTLLAILILCWYGPLENILITHFNAPLKTVLPMLILCPPCIAAALAFVVYSLKEQRAAVSATLLSIALFIRQQTLSAHGMQHKFDWFALFAALNLLLTAFAYWFYRHRVIWKPVETPKNIVNLQA